MSYVIFSTVQKIIGFSAIIHDKPPFLCLSVDAPPFLVIVFGGFEYAFGQRVEHTVAAAVAYDKIIGKGCHAFNVEK